MTRPSAVTDGLESSVDAAVEGAGVALSRVRTPPASV
jgi:hypothetical protein